ncbi:hypothetical protein H6G94_01565 [Nostoc punctiforme FACHB-252]|uniref:Uncharacterized protein n=1 Tax=Nostoc punctiforme FACHB-252 TaxID=1357509 RepID=A0ABR8H3W0_NOSPU|nr:hypothetical protein [Nostoc punctiforme]MBD2609972.1 hypothetical protein [Nostoc punctiforme FACHB-252]
MIQDLRNNYDFRLLRAKRTPRRSKLRQGEASRREVIAKNSGIAAQYYVPVAMTK